ncbi:MAG: Excinuclease ABC, subunit A [Candidatus Uhrbacteria bacterium GW2011_GWE2_40_58]|nr:MAG: Excinuclease ABC, subunit A [Candidatus Uhrbacteria bacterium GW2011_GWF2_40_263]KKR67556.1 MAG: Excinuclease ABC, subunit A [Candidatus Uhrbacteria bacterium GW2011_GWE2_40_58]OGL93694.1 MAG: ABC-ATPase UvrA [Candidatus Uhrbacteria bacterium RIFOXYA2_FULL_40_9]OGL96483.1 MAG: ABC-ATPase UvrA [Candidatus Uhrbacteria bacterium RIFOXYB2_FULL_41_18]HBK34582.1 excinuclease ABC subunit A [Candidatus Uhrbacteria bacterium]
MSTDKITIKGAREHNLKNINLEIPRNQMVCLTGVSGSGKSSLAFDTIFAEGQRRYVESLSAYARQFLGQMEKPDVDEIEGLSPAISIDQKAHSSNPRSTVATITEIYDYLRVLYARIGTPHCVKCQKPIQKLTNEEMVDVVLNKITPELDSLESAKGKQLSILAPVVQGRKGEYYQLLYDLYNSGFIRVRIDGKVYRLDEQIKLTRYQQHTIELIIDTIAYSAFLADEKVARQRLAEGLETAVEKGNDVALIIFADKTEQLLSSKFSCPKDGFSFPEIEPRLFSFNSPYGYCQACSGLGTKDLFSEEICPVCQGARLREESLSVFLPSRKQDKKIGLSIVDVTALSISEAVDYFDTIAFSDRQKEIAGTALREIQNRLKFLKDVGLHYLTLDRRAGTLSGGEAQRIRLASQVGSRLVGAMYILDEPTIGLHQRDNDRLIETLHELRDIGNTVIVVEHDEDTIRQSDYMIEIGPGAGEHGGHVVASGPIPEIFQDKKSLTAAYLRGEKRIEIPSQRRHESMEKIKIKGANGNNLQGIDVEIPLRRFICVTGVSGSGKSTLAYETMYKAAAKRLYGTKANPAPHKALLGLEYIDKAILINQAPIGRTSRSNPATYTGAWGPIRELFASTSEARFRGYTSGRFSFNRPLGRCEQCEGHGTLAIEMHFLPTVYITCDVCKGRRFDRETLEIEFKEKNIHQVLEMTIEEATVFFKEIPAIYDKLKTLNEVGLGYLKLGQSAPTLSGGEAQRVKLASELSKRSTGRTLYLLDEPTTGLHFEDIQDLLVVLQRIVSKGNTVVVIEHNLDVIKCADWIIDLGPEGGDKGGTVVATGTPEEVARTKGSFTGEYLRKVLQK